MANHETHRPPGGPGRPQAPEGGGGRGGRQRKSDDEYRVAIRQVFGANFEQQILHPEGDYNAFLESLKRYVRERATNITPHQLRNIFSRVKAAKQPGDLYRLRPQLAYVAGRAEKEEMRELVVLLDDLIKQVNDTDTLGSFRSFYEAIIAYHKYYAPGS
jgi:CRISPR type III-A-associated protein Csm2